MATEDGRRMARVSDAFRAAAYVHRCAAAARFSNDRTGPGSTMQCPLRDGREADLRGFDEAFRTASEQRTFGAITR